MDTSGFCPGCSGRLRRVRRSLTDRLFYSAVYKCHDCGRNVPIDRPLRYFLSLATCCPRCGNRKLDRLRQPDTIDPFYLNPLSLFQGLFNAPIYYCHWCRIQFYDFRPRWIPARKREEGEQAKGATAG